MKKNTASKNRQVRAARRRSLHVERWLEETGADLDKSPRPGYAPDGMDAKGVEPTSTRKGKKTANAGASDVTPLAEASFSDVDRPTLSSKHVAGFDELTTRIDVLKDSVEQADVKEQQYLLEQQVGPIALAMNSLLRKLVEGPDPDVAVMALQVMAKACSIATTESSGLLRAQAAARFLDRSASLVQTLAVRGELGALVGDEYRFPLAQLKKFKSIPRPTGVHRK